MYIINQKANAIYNTDDTTRIAMQDDTDWLRAEHPESKGKVYTIRLFFKNKLPVESISVAEFETLGEAREAFLHMASCLGSEYRMFDFSGMIDLEQP